VIKHVGCAAARQLKSSRDSYIERITRGNTSMVVNNAHWKDKLRKGEAVSGSQVLIDVSEIHGMSEHVPNQDRSPIQPFFLFFL
jgi:hypothetical protein